MRALPVRSKFNCWHKSPRFPNISLERSRISLQLRNVEHWRHWLNTSTNTHLSFGMKKSFKPATWGVLQHHFKAIMSLLKWRFISKQASPFNWTLLTYVQSWQCLIFSDSLEEYLNETYDSFEINGTYWNPHIFDAVTLAPDETVIHCMVSCEMWEARSCDLFVKDGSDCYLGHTSLTNSTSFSIDSEGPVYTKGGKFEKESRIMDCLSNR